MIAIIALIVAGAVFLAGRHLGWFDKAQPESSQATATVTVCKGLATMTRGGIATELTGETLLRNGDTVCVTSGYVCVCAEDSSLLIGEGAQVQVISAAKRSAVILVEKGEVFCQAGSHSVSLRYGDYAVQAADCVLACSVRAGAQTLYTFSGTVSDGKNTVSAGNACSYVGADRSVSALDLRSLSTFVIDCALGCSQTLFCSAQDLSAVLDARNVVSESIIPVQKTDTQKNPVSDSTPSDSKPSDVKPSDSTPSNANPSDSTPSDANPSDSKPSAEEKTLTCTIEIRCDTILNNMSDLNAGLDVYVPSNGIILPTTTVSFTKGETVYDVLQRICRQKGIQIEASWTPMYDSYYVEGINHLYEFDCGNESGWMYKVDGWFPNYGCSSYELKNGEAIVWCYTCQGFGADVGGGLW